MEDLMDSELEDSSEMDVFVEDRDKSIGLADSSDAPLEETGDLTVEGSSKPSWDRLVKRSEVHEAMLKDEDKDWR